MAEHFFVHPGAKLGKDVKIGPYAVIEDDVEIGDNTVIGPNATIMSGARIGNNCRIFPGAVVAAIPQDLKFKGEYTLVEIGDNTTIRECATINRGTSDRGKTLVGNNCLLMAYTHVAHDVFIGNNVIMANGAMVAGHVDLEDNVILEGMVGVQQFIRIGRFAFVTGKTGVRKNVPPFVKAAREPISYAGVNTIGLKRSGFDIDKIKLLEDVYRLIYVTNKNLARGLDSVKEEFGEEPLAREVVDFIESSERGVIKRLI